MSGRRSARSLTNVRWRSCRSAGGVDGGQRLPVRVAANDGGDGVGEVFTVECARAGQHLKEQATERPHVAPAIGGAPFRLLGAHVAGGAEDDAGLRGAERHGRRVCRGGAVGRPVAVVQRLAETEVEHLRLTVSGQHHVGGFQVAVDDAFLVGRDDRVRDLAGEVNRVVGRHRPRFLEHHVERLAVHEFEDEVRLRIGGFEAMDPGDVRMVQRGEELRLPLEARHAIVVGGDRCVQRLDCDRAIELGIAGAIHLAHATFAEKGRDFVQADSGAGREGHLGSHGL